MLFASQKRQNNIILRAESNLVAIVLGSWFTINDDVTRSGLDVTADHWDCGRFSSSVMTEQNSYLILQNVKIDFIHGPDSFRKIPSELLDQTSYLDNLLW